MRGRRAFGERRRRCRMRCRGRGIGIRRGHRHRRHALRSSFGGIAIGRHGGHRSTRGRSRDARGHGGWIRSRARGGPVRRSRRIRRCLATRAAHFPQTVAAGDRDRHEQERQQAARTARRHHRRAEGRRLTQPALCLGLLQGFMDQGHALEIPLIPRCARDAGRRATAPRVRTASPGRRCRRWRGHRRSAACAPALPAAHRNTPDRGRQ